MTEALHIAHSVGYALGLLIAVGAFCYVCGVLVDYMADEPGPVRRYNIFAMGLTALGVAAAVASNAAREFCSVENPPSQEEVY